MDLTLDGLSQKLMETHIKPSFLRIKILEYLLSYSGHPTAEEVFYGLRDVNPPLSRATVYNTLALFSKNGLVHVVMLEDNEKRYDVNLDKHGHFRCLDCGVIFDFPVDFDSIAVSGLDECWIDQKDVYFKGVCSRCLKK